MSLDSKKKKSNKATDTCPIVFGSASDRYMIPQMCDKLKQPFLLKYCLNRRNTQEMLNKDVGFYQPALKFILDWVAANKITEKLYNAVFSNGITMFVDTDFIIFAFFIIHIDLNNIKMLQY